MIGIYVLAFVGLFIIAVSVGWSRFNTTLAVNPIVAIILAVMGTL